MTGLGLLRANSRHAESEPYVRGPAVGADRDRAERSPDRARRRRGRDEPSGGARARPRRGRRDRLRRGRAGRRRRARHRPVRRGLRPEHLHQPHAAGAVPRQRPARREHPALARSRSPRDPHRAAPRRRADVRRSAAVHRRSARRQDRPDDPCDQPVARRAQRVAADRRRDEGRRRRARGRSCSSSRSSPCPCGADRGSTARGCGSRGRAAATTRSALVASAEHDRAPLLVLACILRDQVQSYLVEVTRSTPSRSTRCPSPSWSRVSRRRTAPTPASRSRGFIAGCARCRAAARRRRRGARAPSPRRDFESLYRDVAELCRTLGHALSEA